MVHNPITEEIRETRHRLAAQFDNDVSRIGAETRRRQAASGRRVVRLPSRPPITKLPANNPRPLNGGVECFTVENLSSPTSDR